MPVLQYPSSWFGALLCLLVAAAGLWLWQLRRMRSVTARFRESDRRLHESQRLAQLGSWEFDLRTRQLTWSEEVYRIFDFDLQRTRPSYEAFLDAVHPADREVVDRAYLKSIETKQPWEISYRLLMADGRLKTLTERGETFYAPDGTAVRSIGTVQDITETARLAAAVKDQRDFARLLLDTAPVVIIVLDPDGRVRHVNAAFEELTAYRADDIRGKDWFATMLPERDRATVRTLFHQAASVTATRGNVNPIILRSGEERDLEWHDSVIRNADGQVTGLLAVGQDVTDRHRAEQAELAARQRTQRIFDTMASFVALLTPEGVVVDINRAPLEAWRIERQDVVGRPLWEPAWLAVFPETQDVVREAIRRAARGETVRLDLSVPSAGATPRTIDATFGPVRDQGGRIIQVVASAIDISDRKRMEATVVALNEELQRQLQDARDSRRLFATAFHSNPIAMGLRRISDDVILDVNVAFEELIGLRRDDLVGKTVASCNFYPRPESRSAVLERLDHGELAKGMELEIRRASGENVPVVMTVNALSLVGEPCSLATFVDLRQRVQSDKERSALQADLRQSQKMRALGTFASGIAHDFNNILTAIVGNLDVIADSVQAGSAGESALGVIRAAVRRATGLINQIVTFSRGQTAARQPIALAECVEETRQLLSAMLPPEAELSTFVAPDVPEVMSDRTEIQQILLNLSKNAWQALEGQRGRISIRVEPQEIGVTAEAALRDLRPGRYVRISVTDTGTGIEAGIRDRIFEPFFSTKETGIGTGLGLAVVHGLVQSHEGAIRVDSTVGQGTTVAVWLPAVTANAAAKPPEVTCPRQSRPSGQRVLYIDDDDLLLRFICRMLDAYGYRTTGFSSPMRALKAVRDDPKAFDIVLTDHNMAEMSGLEVIRELRDLRPNLPVALVSAFIDDNVRRQAAALGVINVISKSAPDDSLCEAIQQLLDEGDARARAAIGPSPVPATIPPRGG